MVVAGSEHEIYAISSNCPGSWHDNQVFESSDLFIKLHDEGWRPFPGALILADSAYRGTHSFLATPFLEGSVGNDRRKRAYNDAFKTVRCSVERTIGIWKRRFPVLNKLRIQDMAKCDGRHG